jgi:hypothetical protein
VNRIATAATISGLLLCTVTVGSAQNRTRPTTTATRINSSVAIDGRLDDAVWSTVPAITEFTQQRPNEASPPSEKTEVRIVYDDEAIYIGARMFDSHGAAGVTTQLVRRDVVPESDLLRIDFDPYHDRLHSVEFDVNPSGWRGDAADNDRSWDPVWQAEARIDSLGWTAEIRIPFSQLRFSRDSIQTWGLNLTRKIQRNQERDLWAYWGQKEAGGVAFFGDLAGLQIQASPERAELLPYVVARAERTHSDDPASPFYDPHTTGLRVGGDLKYLLTSSFTLSASVNPDFGQVEVDPAVVNLSAYETFFPERRPFFIERSDLFDFGGPGCNINCGFGLNMFYSRRIGRSPQGSALAYARGPYVDLPENTTILGAAKLTGRTRSGLTVGLIDAVTRREDADVQISDGTLVVQPVEPLTNSFVGRAKQEFMKGNLVIGGIATSTDRKLDNAGLKTLLPRSARGAGLDVDYYWKQHMYHIYAAVSGSLVAGDSLAIRRVQRANARYLQRPDRTSFIYDPSATSLGGFGAILRFDKSAGSWIGDFNAASVSPSYETNDLGFLQEAGWRWVNGTLGRQFTTPTRAYRSITIMAGAEQYWNFDGDVTQRDASIFANYEFLNYWRAVVIAQRSGRQLSERLTRGGPVVARPAGTVAIFQLSSDPRRRIVINSSALFGISDDRSTNQSYSLTATLRPSPNVKLSLGPGYSRSEDVDQYIRSVTDPTATAFYGTRYVFSHVETKQLFMNTRASVTFTPKISLEVFAQPLIFGGDYFDFEEFAAPRTEKKLVYGRDVGTITSSNNNGHITYLIDPDATGPAASFTVDNPDFNFRSLRGTSVLRWEWRPGSTAYLVWTQTRSGLAEVGNLNFSRDQSALFNQPSDNIFALKISYWIGL